MASFFDALPATEPSALTAFAGNTIERRSEHRTAASVTDALKEADARLYLFRGDKVLLRGDDPLFTRAEAAALDANNNTVVLLGWAESGPRLVATIPDSAFVDEAKIALTDLRSLAMGGGLSAEHLGALAQARSLANWHSRHGFCANCGAATTISNGGYRRDCPACGVQHFPRTDPVVIMLTIAGDTVLLGRQKHFAPGMYSCLAGFVEPGETIEAAVRRETLEESGIAVGRVRYNASQPWPFPASLMIGCHAEALSTTIQRDETELEDCRWFPRDEVKAMIAGTHPEGIKTPMGYAIARHLINAWIERG